MNYVVLCSVSSFSFHGSVKVTLQNSIKKDEYIGEYTGELISHREADKRGKLYDYINTSYLFNLNNQVTIMKN